MINPLQPGLAAALLLAANAFAAQAPDTLIDTLQAPDWNLADITEYAVEDLDTLAAAHREEILDFGFRRALEFELTGPGGEVSVTLYDMIDSTAAFGLFTMERDYTDLEFETASLGTESYQSPDLLVFWQSNFVGKIRGPRNAASAAAEFLTLRLPGVSRKAPVSMHLPGQDLIVESERYILTESALETEAHIDPDALGLENSVEVALADYGNGNSLVRLALLMYPTPQLASVQTEAWLGSVDEAPPNRRVGPLLAIVTESNSPELADAVLSRLTYQTETTWNEPPRDPLTVPELILAIFLWIGVALLFTLVMGVGFGGFRIYMKTHYPSRFFPSDEGDQLIQLHINQ